MGMVYRAVDRLNRQMVALKRVTLSTEKTSPSANKSNSDTRLLLAHEFQTLASLHHPHVINVLDYGFDSENLPYFTMTLLENAKTIVDAGAKKSQDQKIKLLIQTLQALSYLHRRGVIHRDLKPDNALVSAEGDVKVLDFGLATLREHQSAEEEMAGTLAYMPPEILTGHSANEASDLYGVGMIAYELFAGQHPFDVHNFNTLIQDILYTSPDFSKLDVDDTLVEIIERLLDKTPENRYPSAHEVILAFSNVLDEVLPYETAAIRESFLQAAQFIGRDKELKLLTDGLSQTAVSRGSAWIIGGESGVGKSRLLAELRTRALVAGALVLHGQAVAEGGLPYQLWREPLRRLMLSSDLSDFDAGVLKQLVPDIDDLLERPIPEVAELEGQAGQQRLLQTILGVFRRQTQPIVLILEDLQWVVESLDVLRPLVALTPELPLLIVANYREDEKPGLPDELPGMQMIRLERLKDDGIMQLSVSMLGDSGRNPEVLALLKKETEGNIFFLVEVVRALAEEAGKLSEVGTKTLPSQIFAGGIQQVVKRRLAQVPAHDQNLLRIAAVAGRQLDLKVIQTLSPQTDLENWLTVCSEAAVLDTLDEKWRFAHDKLREGLLASLSETERQQIHLQVAGALEHIYADKLDEYAAVIGDHYEHANQFTHAAQWFLQAGKHAQTTYAPLGAISFYRKALAYLPEDDSYRTQRLLLYEGLGTMLNWQAHYPEAVEMFTLMAEEASKIDDAMAQTTALLGMTTAHIYQGDFRSATEIAEQVEPIARAANLRLKLAQALFVKGWNAFRTGAPQTAIEMGEEVMAICKELDNRPQMAQCLNLMGAVHYTLGNYEQAGSQFGHASDILQELGNRDQAMALINNIGVIADARGDYQSALTRYQEALAIAREIGIRDAEMLYLSNLGGAYVRLGEFQTAQSHLRKVIDMAEVTGFGQIAETYRFLAETQMALGNLDEAAKTAKRALALSKAIESHEFIAATWRTLGNIAARLDSALDIIDEEDLAKSTSYDAAACFSESIRISEETGMEGERARTLKDWSLFEKVRGDSQKAAQMWEEAKEIFQRSGAIFEVARM